jgi:hypothetical protein
MNICSEKATRVIMINRPELSRFDPLADTFLDVRIQSTYLPEEGGNGVGALGSAGRHLKLCPPKDVIELTSRVKGNVRRKADVTVEWRDGVCDEYGRQRRSSITEKVISGRTLRHNLTSFAPSGRSDGPR